VDRKKADTVRKIVEVHGDIFRVPMLSVLWHFCEHDVSDTNIHRAPVLL